MSPLHQKSWAKENGKGASHGVSRLGFGVNFAHYLVTYATLGGASQMALEVKNLLANAGDIRDLGSIPGSGRPPGRGNGHPLHYSCLEKTKDRGAWWATAQRVIKSQTGLK